MLMLLQSSEGSQLCQTDKKKLKTEKRVTSADICLGPQRLCLLNRAQAHHQTRPNNNFRMDLSHTSQNINKSKHEQSFQHKHRTWTNYHKQVAINSINFSMSQKTQLRKKKKTNARNQQTPILDSHHASNHPAQKEKKKTFASNSNRNPKSSSNPHNFWGKQASSKKPIIAIGFPSVFKEKSLNKNKKQSQWNFETLDLKSGDIKKG